MTTILTVEQFLELKNGDYIEYLGVKYEITSSIIETDGDQYSPGTSYFELDNNKLISLSVNYLGDVQFKCNKMTKLKDGTLVLLD